MYSRIMLIPITAGALVAFASFFTLAVLACAFILFGLRRSATLPALAGLLLAVAATSFGTVVLSNPLYSDFFPAAHLSNLAIVLFGPLCFFYIVPSLDRAFRWNKRTVAVLCMSLLPFVFAVAGFSFEVGKGLLKSKYFFHNEYKLFETAYTALWLGAVPVIAARRGVRPSRFFADFRDMHFTWYRFLWLTLIVLWLNKLYIVYQYEFQHSIVSYLQGISVYFVVLAFFLSIVLFANLNRDLLFSAPSFRGNPARDPADALRFERLDFMLRQKKLYLDPDMSLLELAQKSGIPSRELSRLINTGSGLHFNEYINRYRIEEACAMLRDPANQDSVLQILLDCGFNSKSTFNTAFKKQVGRTPLEYRLLHNPAARSSDSSFRTTLAGN